MVVEPGPVTGSEDIGLLARGAGAPGVFWLLGDADPSDFEGASDVAARAERVAMLPSNHSPMYVPLIDSQQRRQRLVRGHS